MRVAPALLALVLAAPAVAQQRPATGATEARVRAEAEGYLAICLGGSDADREFCQMQRTRFVDDYLRARAGDYAAQRNVAHQFAQRTAPLPVQTNLIQACAWRVVVLLSGHAQVSDLDQGSMRAVCSQLDQVGRQGADVRAEALRRQIASDPVRNPPPRPAPPVRPAGPLDGEARPLTADPPRPR